MIAPWFLLVLIALSYPVTILIWTGIIYVVKFWRMSALAKAVLQVPLLIIIALGWSSTVYYLALLHITFGVTLNGPAPTVSETIIYLLVSSAFVLLVPWLLNRGLKKQDPNSKDKPPFPIFNFFLELIGLIIGESCILFVFFYQFLIPIFSGNRASSSPIALIGYLLILIGCLVLGTLMTASLFGSSSPHVKQLISKASPLLMKRLRLGSYIVLISGSVLLIISLIWR